MQMPNVPHVVTDSERNIKFTVMAFRQLSQGEVLQAIRHFCSTKPGKRLKKNSECLITTGFGAHD